MAKSKTKTRDFGAGMLAFFAISGTLLIAAGVVTLLAIVGGLRGAFFDGVKSVMQGLAGSLCLGLSLLLIWGGVIVAFSAGRGMPKRAFFLITLLYIAVLGLIDLVSTVGMNGYMEYLLGLNNAAKPPMVDAGGFVNMTTACYSLCSSMGVFGGAIGMLMAWPAWRFLDTVIGTVVLGLICLICVLLFARFDVQGWITSLRGGSEQRRAEREQKRLQLEYQQALEEQQRQEEEAARRLLTPAYDRRGKKGRQPAPVPPAPYPAYGGMVAQPVMPGMYVQPPVQPGYVQPPQVEMYDEVMVPQGAQLPWQKGKKSKGELGMQAVKKASIGSPSFQPEAPPEPSLTEDVQAVKDAKILSTSRSKAVEQLEQIRRRKAELAMALKGNEIARQDDMPIYAAEGLPPQQPQTQPVPFAQDEPAVYQRPAQPKPSAEPKPQTAARQEIAPASTIPYVFPSVELLNQTKTQQVDTRAADMDNAKKLERTLESFGIPSRVQRVTHGPAVTRFELGLTSSGINVKRIMSIAENIALDLAANGDVRIEIPIPGTNLFGVEVPNIEVQSVSFAEVLTSPEMQAAKSPLAVALGRDISGTPIICDLAKMPHLLIAGTTGSGKSVCINSIITSILYRSSPDDVRMIMIDPKVVELQSYNVVPHLLIPVVSDPHKAAGALAWAVAEMLDRYHRIQSKHARDITGYNAKLAPGEAKMPRIVIVIDELADLMMACKKEVESSIIRIAQLARAAGIHMVVATQRPTVDVITGLIKSNLPSRIAFSVKSGMDSRNILDEVGAERLLGKGDMLYMPIGMKPPKRVQGCYMSDEEIESVTGYIGTHSHVDFDPDVIEALENEDTLNNLLDDDENEDELDERLPEAIEIAINDGQVSTSMLQRRMRIGYARAGRLVDDMAARGIVSKAAGSKPREILMSREEYERIKDTLFSK